MAPCSSRHASPTPPLTAGCPSRSPPPPSRRCTAMRPLAHSPLRNSRPTRLWRTGTRVLFWALGHLQQQRVPLGYSRKQRRRLLNWKRRRRRRSKQWMRRRWQRPPQRSGRSPYRSSPQFHGFRMPTPPNLGCCAVALKLLPPSATPPCAMKACRAAVQQAALALFCSLVVSGAHRLYSRPTRSYRPVRALKSRRWSVSG
mmetsp:Transcript_22631/g.73183  ORF Transcript_22631/g.73183 Transcript_22631/m.73183 type:complete len:200 (+) Transcript_22631:1291-1890(+)